MNYIIVGLGNPGAEYEGTRHNVGRAAVEEWRKKNNWPEFVGDKKLNAQKTIGQVDKNSVILLLPEGLMNNSGKSLAPAVKSVKQAERVVVLHDDLDLPLGSFKISFNRGAAGHRGVLSIIKALKTEKFVRLRLGVSPQTPSGKLKKPVGEKAVVNFILGKFKSSETVILKKVFKKTSAALDCLIASGRERAMSEFNQ